VFFLRVEEFDFELPPELIAQEPLPNRAGSRLLVLNRQKNEIYHDNFVNFPQYLRAGDVLVLNDTRVLPARLIGRKLEGSATVEILLLKRRSAHVWETLVRPGRRLPPGTHVIFGKGELMAKIIDALPDGGRLVEFFYEGIFEEILNKLGEMPLPPYIKKKLEDKERYQTVFAKESGSAAAPTAGLHFTPEILAEIKKRGVEIIYLTLHVGLGTFRPVTVSEVHRHKMHSEYYRFTEEAARKINYHRKKGGRIIAVGTTSCRTLETVADEQGRVQASSGWTEIFIYPGYHFKATDALLTNFHLPRSTLLMLVSAFAGKEKILSAYHQAIERGYRFFSFGDAMFIY